MIKRWEIEIEKFFKWHEILSRNFGEYAFRKLDSTKLSRAPINKTIFEIQVFLLGSGKYSKSQIEHFIVNKEMILEMMEYEMKNNKSF